MKLRQSEWKLFAKCGRILFIQINKQADRQTIKHINKWKILYMVVLTKGRKVCWVTRHVRCLAFPEVCYTRFRIAWNYHNKSKKHFPDLKLPPKAEERLKWMRCLYLSCAIKNLFKCSYENLTVTSRTAMTSSRGITIQLSCTQAQPKTVSQDWISGKKFFLTQRTRIDSMREWWRSSDFRLHVCDCDSC